MSDSLSVLIWWLTIFVIGTIFLPITFSLFHKFIDRGYIFAKVIGILLSSYLVWLLGSLKITPFERFTLAIILIIAAITNLYLLKRIGPKNLLSKLPLPLIIFEECLFFVALAFWSYVRATEPSIRGLEKFMDFGFVNSILRGQFFPPLDMWLTQSPDFNGGYFINYYYFGHYVTAFLTKLSGIDSAVTYNLMMATLFAFTLTLSFSIGMNLYYLFISGKRKADGTSEIYKQPKIPILKTELNAPIDRSFLGDDTAWQVQRNLKKAGVSEKFGIEAAKAQDPQIIIKAVIAGLLAAFIVTLGGNLHTIYTLTSNYPLENPAPPWKLDLGFYPERYWYPNATRFIPFTIHEFPIYSFVVADLHGHVSDIPFVLLTIALLLSLLIKNNTQTKDVAGLKKFLQEFEDHTSIPLHHIALLGLLLGVMYMTNAWDGLIYMILAGLVFLYINLKNSGSDLKRPKGLTLFGTTIYKTFSASLFLLFFFLVVNLPFSLNFKPFASGIGVLCAPSFLLGKKIGPFLFEAGKCQKSPIWMLIILWGFFYYNVIGFLIFIVLPYLRQKLAIRSWKLDREAGNKKLEKCQTSNFKLHDPTSNFPLLTSIDIFVLLLIFISTLLLIFPEFLYIKDIYPAHYRANTMFKLGYQAFMILGLASGYIILRLKHTLREVKKKFSFILYNSLFILLFTLIGIYPYFAINSYYGGLRTYQGLDGLKWLSTAYNDDYKAIVWLRKNVSSQSVVVEAQGDSYTDYARVSANTGLPTIVGWPVHEWLWRGSYDEAGRRIPEVTAIYESKDLNLTREILKKYNVEYIFVGNLEREKYKQLDEKKLEKLGKVVFESGKTRVYKVNH